MDPLGSSTANISTCSSQADHGLLLGAAILVCLVAAAVCRKQLAPGVFHIGFTRRYRVPAEVTNVRGQEPWRMQLKHWQADRKSVV